MHSSCKLKFELYYLHLTDFSILFPNTLYLLHSYYTKGFDGPNRQSIETEDPQQKLQTAQYGSRNDAWVGVDEAKSEIEYLQGETPPLDFKDLKMALTDASKAFKYYISLAPADQVDIARQQEDGGSKQ